MHNNLSYMQRKAPIHNIIHSCRFGNKSKDQLSLHCARSWEKFCKDYKFIERWSNNFDSNKHHYTQRAYNNHQRAFLSDYVRIWALYNQWGIYLDTDIEIIKPIDSLLEQRVFIWFADEKNIGTAVIWWESWHPLFKDILEYYDQAKECSGNNKIITDILHTYGLPHDRDMSKIYQLDEGIVVYPKEYFEPIDYTHRYKTPEENKKYYATSNSYTIHYSNLSWITPRMRCKHYTGVALEQIWIRKPLKKLLIKIGVLNPKIYWYD